jgi:diguanylate cyclase (GGDEF)-like protein
MRPPLSVWTRIATALSQPKSEPMPIPTQVQSARSWRELPGVARVFVAAVSAIGVAVVLSALPVVTTTRPWLLATLLALALPASVVKVSFPRSVSTLTVGQVLNYFALLMLGPQAAVLVAATSAWSQCTFRSRYRNPSHQTLFSVAALACAIRVAGAAYVHLGGHPGAWDPSTAVVPFAVAAAVYFVVNAGLVAIAIGLSSEQSATRVWHETFLWSWPTYLFGAGMAGAAVTGIKNGGLWLLPLLGVALWSTFQNLRAYLVRFNDSVTDPLTGLLNQRFVLPHAAREIGRARRNGTSVAVMVVDLNGFKSINDTYGHAVGDSVLRQLAQTLQQFTRSCDVCARHGGDEFLLVLPGCDSAAAERKGRDLQALVAAMRPLCVPNFNASLAISVGTAVYPSDAESVDDLLVIADDRMYRNKSGPRMMLVKPRFASTVNS